MSHRQETRDRETFVCPGASQGSAWFQVKGLVGVSTLTVFKDQRNLWTILRLLQCFLSFIYRVCV